MQPAHGEQAPGRELAQNVRHVHLGLVPQHVGIEVHVPGLALVVELLAQALRQLLVDPLWLDRAVVAAVDAEDQPELRQIAHLTVRGAVVSDDRLGGGRGPSSTEGGESVEHPLLGVCKQGVAPVDGGAQRLLPGFGRPGTGGQQAESMRDLLAISRGDIAVTRAAASSIAKGIPSSAWQIWPTASSCASIGTVPGRIARARSTNSCDAGKSRTVPAGVPSRRGLQRTDGDLHLVGHR